MNISYDSHLYEYGIFKQVITTVGNKNSWSWLDLWEIWFMYRNVMKKLKWRFGGELDKVMTETGLKVNHKIHTWSKRNHMIY